MHDGMLSLSLIFLESIHVLFFIIVLYLFFSFYGASAVASTTSARCCEHIQFCIPVHDVLTTLVNSFYCGLSTLSSFRTSFMLHTCIHARTHTFAHTSAFSLFFHLTVLAFAQGYNCFTLCLFIITVTIIM